MRPDPTQTDAGVLDALDLAVAAGSDPALDALTQCTGCKCCGHEGGRKGSIKTHGRTGCAQCGTDTGCTPRGAGGPCQCAFHARQPERLLNRVVRRAALTPGFLDSCRCVWCAVSGLGMCLLTHSCGYLCVALVPAAGAAPPGMLMLSDSGP